MSFKMNLKLQGFFFFSLKKQGNFIIIFCSSLHVGKRDGKFKNFFFLQNTALYLPLQLIVGAWRKVQPLQLTLQCLPRLEILIDRYCPRLHAEYVKASPVYACRLSFSIQTLRFEQDADLRLSLLQNTDFVSL